MGLPLWESSRICASLNAISVSISSMVVASNLLTLLTWSGNIIWSAHVTFGWKPHPYFCNRYESSVSSGAKILVNSCKLIW